MYCSFTALTSEAMDITGHVFMPSADFLVVSSHLFDPWSRSILPVNISVGLVNICTFLLLIVAAPFGPVLSPKVSDECSVELCYTATVLLMNFFLIWVNLHLKFVSGVGFLG